MIKMYFFSAFVLLAFLFQKTLPAPNPGDAVIKEIRTDYSYKLQSFNQSIQHLKSMAKAFDEDPQTLGQLEAAIIATRLAYKQIEHFVAYFQEESNTRYINGAPLPKIDASAPQHSIIPPLGLQTLDEAIFSEAPEASEVIELVEKLEYFWKPMQKFEGSRRMEHRYVFEASRAQVIRIFTLGLTGFDTPGSVNAIPEAIISLETMQNTFKTYDAFANQDAQKLAKNIQALIEYLEDHNDFDTLDRLYLLRAFVNPIYKQIYQLQKSLEIEFIEEADHTMKSVNYHTQEVFHQDFLNKGYFSQIAESDLEDPRKIELGKLLFFDPALSKDLGMSCATCHQPEKGFTDGLPKSQSNTPGKSTLRNAPTIINSVYAEKYFYDLREYDLERQVKHVVYDKNEFNMDFIDLADRLKESEEYTQLFKEAYGDRDKYGISTWSISNSLAAYVASLSSWNSPFDQYARSERNDYPEAAQKGFNLFMGTAACGTCHFAPTFGGVVPPSFRESESEVIGVPIAPDTANATLDTDPGRIENGRIRDHLEHFAFSFKTTTLRNVALTAPYMHNGVYNTLDEVVDFYNRGGGAGLGMDLPHQTLPFDNLQ
ncbi:MAG: cytochrome c peroxidase [Bacteroidota bacterium]